MNRYHEGQMHSGTLIVTRNLPSDFTYTGTFLNNDFHGIGTIVSQNGSIYQGELAYGQYHGLGTLRTIVVNENVRDEDDNHYRESGSSGGQGHTMSSPNKKNKKKTKHTPYYVERTNNKTASLQDIPSKVKASTLDMSKKAREKKKKDTLF